MVLFDSQESAGAKTWDRVLRAPMKKAVTFMQRLNRPSFAHECPLCVRTNGRCVTKGWGLDGKYGGHQVCNFYRCPNPIVSREIMFCHEHQYLRSICCIDDCEEQFSGNTAHTCEDHSEMEARFNVAKAHKAARRRDDSRSGRYNSTSDTDRISTRTMVDTADDGDVSATRRQGTYKFSASYVPCTSLLMVATCGYIINYRKCFSHERFVDVAMFMEESISLAHCPPDFIFYDRACQIDPYLSSSTERVLQYPHSQSGANTRTRSGEMRHVVDRFHGGAENVHNDELCRTRYQADAIETLNTSDGKKIHNTSIIVESTNAWLGRVIGPLHNVDSVFYDFVVMSLNRVQE